MMKKTWKNYYSPEAQMAAEMEKESAKNILAAVAAEKEAESTGRRFPRETWEYFSNYAPGEREAWEKEAVLDKLMGQIGTGDRDRIMANMSGGFGLAGAAEPPRPMGEIEQEIHRLASLREELHKSISALEGRIAVVLTPPRPQTTEKVQKSPDRERATGLGEILSGTSRSILEAIRRIEDLIERTAL